MVHIIQYDDIDTTKYGQYFLVSEAFSFIPYIHKPLHLWRFKTPILSK